jgi:osmotically inducible protein OsmC
VETKAAATIDKVSEGFKITSMRLTTRATVPNVDRATFDRIAQATKTGCPVSQALAGVKIELDAQLEGAAQGAERGAAAQKEQGEARA